MNITHRYPTCPHFKHWVRRRLLIVLHHETRHAANGGCLSDTDVSDEGNTMFSSQHKLCRVDDFTLELTQSTPNACLISSFCASSETSRNASSAFHSSCSSECPKGGFGKISQTRPADSRNSEAFSVPIASKIAPNSSSDTGRSPDSTRERTAPLHVIFLANSLCLIPASSLSLARYLPVATVVILAPLSFHNVATILSLYLVFVKHACYNIAALSM